MYTHGRLLNKREFTAHAKMEMRPVRPGVYSKYSLASTTVT